MKVVFKVADKRNVLTSEVRDRAVKTDIQFDVQKKNDINSDKNVLSAKDIKLYRKMLRDEEFSESSETIDDNNQNALKDKRKSGGVRESFSNANVVIPLSLSILFLWTLN